MDDKQYLVSLIIEDANDLWFKYNKLYCVVSLKSINSMPVIVGFNFYRSNMNRYKLHYITKQPRTLK
jgi:hypothetical protein